MFSVNVRAHFFKGVLFCVCIFISLRSLAVVDDWAAPLRDAQTALNEQRFGQAYPLFMEHAQQENGLAQFSVALFHHLGWGRDVDVEQACFWFVKAANNNIPASLAKAGDCVMRGLVNDAGPQRAFEYYMAAFKQNVYSAGCAAGKLLIHGHLGANRIDDGVALCEQAAEAGAIDAALLVAKWHFHGENTKQNYPLALDMFQRANPEKQPEAAFYIAQYFDKGLHIQQDFQQATFWYEMAAQEGWQPAYLPCAALYWSLYTTSADNRDVFLAKAYLWAKASSLLTNETQGSELLALMDAVNREVPPAWKQDLDEKVMAHLHQFGT